MPSLHELVRAHTDLVEDETIVKNLETAVIVQSDFDTGQTPQQLTPEEDKRWLEAWSRVQQGG